ncbi:MAG: ABC transporter permease [Ilumatobacter coccineus]|uniref:ABC transporter permease n=1 Tax=Ilumatobacter coccineus TaxID=467094 RepID=A0A2G6KHF8_9ACTN|nr:MAG: ABC transporter permease [Ilumatobacter coccineus]
MTWLTDPYGWWIQPFVDNAFVRDALIAALLAAIATSLIGTWVILKGLSFLGDALAHGVLPGIAIAVVVGGNTTVGALLAALAMVGGVQVIRTASPLPNDASIGILFVGFLALAVVVMSAQPGGGDLTRFLFGSITAVDSQDLVMLAVITALTAVAVVILYRPLMISTFDPIQARLIGFRPQLTHLVFLVLLALTIVASFEIIGSLLVFAFLIAPPATASLLVRRVSSIMIVAVLIGSLSATVGILISYHDDTAAGATMALVTVTVFVITLIVRSSVSTGMSVWRSRQSSANSADVSPSPSWSR